MKWVNSLGQGKLWLSLLTRRGGKEGVGDTKMDKQSRRKWECMKRRMKGRYATTWSDLVGFHHGVIGDLIRSSKAKCANWIDYGFPLVFPSIIFSYSCNDHGKTA